MIVPVGTTSVIDTVFIQDSTSADGGGLTGVTSGSSGLAGRYYYPGGTAAALTFESITTLGTYQAPTSNAHIRIREIDASNMPGWYELHYHNDWFSVASSRRFAGLRIGGVADMVQLNYKVEIDYALQPTTKGRTLEVESDGMAHADVKEIKTQDATDALEALLANTPVVLDKYTRAQLYGLTEVTPAGGGNTLVTYMEDDGTTPAFDVTVSPASERIARNLY